MFCITLQLQGLFVSCRTPDELLKELPGLLDYILQQRLIMNDDVQEEDDGNDPLDEEDSASEMEGNEVIADKEDRRQQHQAKANQLRCRTGGGVSEDSSLPSPSGGAHVKAE